MFDLGTIERSESPLYDWNPTSTYIADLLIGRERLRVSAPIERHAPLAILGDNITTDHLSPSNAIQLNSAAGAYLAKMGLPEADFNSYATHRGDHLTAQRATFCEPEVAQRDGARKWRGSAGLIGTS